MSNKPDGPSVVENRKAITFGLKVYKQILKAMPNHTNLLIPPFVLYKGLGLLNLVVPDSDSKEELAAVLGAKRNQQDTAKVFWRMICKYLKRGGNKRPIFLARLFIDKKFELKKDTKELMKTYFRISRKAIDIADASSVANTFNQWAKRKSGNAITKVAEPSEIDTNQEMFLVCITTFKARWQYQFYKPSTANVNFQVNDTHVVKVPMMFLSKKKLRYGVLGDLQFFNLYFKDDEHAMFFILPKNLQAFRDVESKIETFDIIGLRRSMTIYDMSVAIPKFRIEMQFPLSEYVRKAGLNLTFSPRSKFTEFTPRPTNLQQGFLSAVVDVQEGGLATDGYGWESGDTNPTVTLNRPFFYAVMSAKHRVFLWGCVSNPSTKSRTTVKDIIENPEVFQRQPADIKCECSRSARTKKRSKCSKRKVQRKNSSDSNTESQEDS